MINQKILNYISQQFTTGVAKESIKANLISQGYSEQDINAGITEVERSATVTIPQAEKKVSIKDLNKHKSYLIIGTILVLLASIFLVYNLFVQKTEISEFTLRASIADAAGIAPTSHFILKTTASLTSKVLEKYIKIIPAIDLSIKKVSAQENTFEIIPESELQPNQIYTIQIDEGPLAIRDISWAYQVKAPFQMISSIPGDKGVDTPTNTGIELYFNREDITNPENFIEITPTVSGRFDISENKVLFIPDNPLTEKTIYTIKIKEGLKAKDTDDIFGDEKIIQFQTAQAYSNNPQPSAYFSRQFAEFKPKSDILLGINAHNTSSIEATVYRFDSAQEFLDSVTKMKGDTPWARYYTDIDNQLPENKKIFSGDLPLETANYSSLLRIPQELQTGYYAIVIASGKNKDVSWFQVNSVASFAAFASSKSLIWLKNIVDEKGMVGVPILFNNKQIGQSDKDGVALFDTPSELIKKPTDPYYTNERNFFVAQIPTGALVIPIESEYGYATSITQNDGWWDYISLNKNIYLPTDTLSFWAIEKPRSGEAVGEEIIVKLTNTYWGQIQDNAVTYAETKLKLSEYNTVTGEISFTNLKPGLYDLTFYKESEIIAKETITVSAYIKPAYKITITSDKSALFAGDSVIFKVKANFFDGTPVTNTPLSYSAYGVSGKNSQGNIDLNSQGEGSFTVTPEYTSGQTYWPSYLSVSVKPTKAEEGQIETNSSVFVFGPHINNSISQKQSDSNVAFTIKTRAVVINNNPRGGPYWNTEEYLGDPVVGAKTKVDISEIIYLKEKTGTGYDLINKLTYPIYKYLTEEHPISSQTITSDQDGSAQLFFVPEEKKMYKFIFTTSDNINRVVKDTRYIYGNFSDTDYNSQDSSYHLFNPDDNKNYKVGDQIDLQLQTRQGVMPPEGQRNYIFMSVNNGTIEYQIQDTAKYNATFQSKDIPNIGIWSGWFSDERFHNSYLQNISFDANQRRLNVTITKDKQTYKPGDNISLDIRVTDKDNKPIQAEVNLSALDEAVFSIRPNEKDTINNLYRDIYSQIIIRTSNMPPYSGGGAEKGGGDGGTPRSNIQEMAIFKSIATDSEGYAHIEFKLPDNITSWRLTSQAVTKDLFAGKDVSFIPVTLPLFIDATLNNTYLAGDQLTLRLRTFGTAATQGNVNYTVESPTLQFKKINETGGSNINIPLGVLSLGNHELTMRVNNGEFSDALTRPLNVLSSYFTKNTSDFYNGVVGLKIKNDAIGYTTLTFSSFGQGQLYKKLRSLSYQWGVRLDQKGTQLIATNLLNTYFEEKSEEPEFQAIKYQAYTGGLQLLPYSSEDLELSAISAHLFNGSEFDQISLKNYLSQSLSDTKADVTRITRALYGLTAFNEPVLTKIQRIKDDKSLTIKDKVFVALALDSIGAKEEARAYYKQVIKPSIQIKSSYAYVGGLESDDTITTTTLVAALTASLEEPETTQLALYVEQNFPKETLNNFQRLLYIKHALPKLNPEEVGFTYETGTKEESKILKNGESFTLTLSPQDLTSLELSNITGRLGIVASYEQQSSPESISKDENLSLSRSYEVNGGVTKEFNEGDSVLIRLTPRFSENALNGYYQIIDYLPSGLRPIDQESRKYYSSYDSRIYPTEIKDQKVTFLIDKNVTMPIYYYARVVSKGTYKAEPALLQSIRSFESITISNEDSLIIK
jgi:alpha-2-macroglobulin